MSDAKQLVLSRLDGIRQFIQHRLHGVCFCLLIVLASSYITEHYGSSQVLAALLLGMAFNSLSRQTEFTEGLNFCASQVMRFGVALLGARITFEQVLMTGYKPVVVVTSVVVATICFSLFLGWICKVDRVKSIISGTAVAICGASAALAVAAILPRDKNTEKHLLCSLVGVTGLSTLAMIIYPGLFTSLNLDSNQIGILLGASIHDVAQVLGAGHMLSENITELATFTKMLRVAMLVPVIALLAWFFPSPHSSTRTALLPPFLIGFIVLLIAANLQLLSASIIDQLAQLSQLCLLVAMAALGTRTNPVEIWRIGAKPMFLLAANTLFIATLGYFLVIQ